jgi:hypothetical protein
MRKPVTDCLLQALRVFALLIPMLIPATGHPQSPYFNWAVKAGGSSDDFSRGIATDSSGNCYLTGSFSGNAVFGSTNLTSAGGYDIFVARYDSAGQAVWTRQAGSGSIETEEGRCITLDSSGNVYVAGGFAGTASFGGTNLTSIGGLDIFLAKYTSAGQLLWARRAGGTGNFEYGLAIAFDPAGNLLVTGQFQGTATFSGTNLVSRGGIDIFLAKYDPAGNRIWVTQAGGAAGDFSRSVVADGAGNSYIAGWFEGDITFGDDTLVPNLGSADAFTAQYDSMGRLRSVFSIGSDRGEQAYGLGIDSSTNRYLLVWQENPGGNRLGLYKLDAAGNSVWIRTARTYSDADARGGLAVDPAGRSVFTSRFQGTASFGTQTLFSQGASDAFAAMYDSEGSLLWVKQMLGTTTEEGRAIAFDPAGNVCLTGWFNGAMSFDSLSVGNSGPGDIFVARLDPPPRLTVNRTGAQVVLSWPEAVTGFELQQSALIPPVIQWQTLGAVPFVVGERQVVTNTIASSNVYFRLRRP